MHTTIPVSRTYIPIGRELRVDLSPHTPKFFTTFDTLLRQFSERVSKKRIFKKIFGLPDIPFKVSESDNPTLGMYEHGD